MSPRTRATCITDVLATCGSWARLAGCGSDGLRRRCAVNLLDLEVARTRQMQQLVGRQASLPDVAAAANIQDARTPNTTATSIGKQGPHVCILQNEMTSPVAMLQLRELLPVSTSWQWCTKGR
jgi:hypothetical protein